MLSTIATLVSFVIPPIANVNSLLSTLRTDVREIVGLTQKSQQRELREFGEYVKRLVQQLVSGMENGQLARQANVAKNLEELQKTLLLILQRISSINEAGGLMSRRHIRFPDEDYISQMRQQLHDALSAFQLGAALELLSNNPNLRAGGTAADPPKPCQPKTPKLSNPPSPEPAPLKPPQAPQSIKLAQEDHFLLPRLTTRPRPQRAKLQPTPLLTTQGSPEIGELSAAFRNVERGRGSLRHSYSPSRIMELASALSELSDLLGKAGRTREALAASQESAELYRSLTEQ